MTKFKSIEWRDPATLRMLDQRKLPTETVYNDYANYADLAQAIKDMVTRGAPAIAISASYGLAITALRSDVGDVDALRLELATAMKVLRASRPTAVNLFWAMDRMEVLIAKPELDSVDALKDAVMAEAHMIAEEDVEINKSIGRNAMPLVPQGAKIIHHCNTGSLATMDYGTALGIIRMAHEEGKDVFALLDETRPRLQGGRLSAYELKEQCVPFMVIADGASGYYMRTLGIDLCVVGADRVAANGDTANKIGTYNLAVVAHENNVPFYVAAPTTTIDMETKHGDEIEIEERPTSEITHFRNCQITPDDIKVGNPAFDVTPSKYITAIVTEKGIVYPPFDENLAKLMG